MDWILLSPLIGGISKLKPHPPSFSSPSPILFLSSSSPPLLLLLSSSTPPPLLLLSSPSKGFPKESLVPGQFLVGFWFRFCQRPNPKRRPPHGRIFGSTLLFYKRVGGHQAAAIFGHPAEISAISGNGVLAVVQFYARSRSVPVSVPVSLAVSVTVSVSVSVSESVSVSAVVSVTASDRVSVNASICFKIRDAYEYQYHFLKYQYEYQYPCQ